MKNPRLDSILTLILASILILPSLTMANQLTSSPNAVDELWVGEHGDFFSKCTLERTILGKDGSVRLAFSSNAEVSTGTVTTPFLKLEFPANELCPSWNVRHPTGSGFTVELRMRGDGNTSRWYFVGAYGDVPTSSTRLRSRDDYGRVDVDYLLLNKPMDEFQYRVTFFSARRDSLPAVVRLFLAYSNTTEDEALYTSRTAGKAPIAATAPELKREVPFYSQRKVRKEIAGQVCCPTSLAMVTNSLGNPTSLTQVIERNHDPVTKIYGNWPHTTQTAFELGFVSYVQRFRTLDQARYQIEKEGPFIISIRASRGELINAPLQSTRGHVIILRGYTKDGDFWVSDPYGQEAKDGQGIYTADEIQKCWLDKGGVGIILLAKGRSSVLRF